MLKFAQDTKVCNHSQRSHYELFSSNDLYLSFDASNSTHPTPLIDIITTKHLVYSDHLSNSTKPHQGDKFCTGDNSKDNVSILKYIITESSIKHPEWWKSRESRTWTKERKMKQWPWRQSDFNITDSSSESSAAATLSLIESRPFTHNR